MTSRPAKNNATALQFRRHLFTNPVIALRQGYTFTGSALGQVPAEIARTGYPRLCIGNRFSIDHENALVTLGNLRDITLNHHQVAVFGSNRLKNDIQIGVLRLNLEY